MDSDLNLDLDLERTVLTMSPNVSTFSVPTRIVFGEGASAEAGRELAALGARRVLVVTDQGLVRAGLVQPICGQLEAAGLGHAAFTDVEANPSVETVERALAAYQSHDCDAILAVGGGSPMDTAKAWASWPPTAATSATTRAWARCGTPCRHSLPFPPPWAPAARSPTLT